ncbi:MAG TPA: hypothetical protein VLE20_02280, partial [Blastocatellia bacterium]|nr:hypothetical protein [Blastocatellia bacterium]
VGFAVLGSILAATLTTTLSAHLAEALPDPTERKEVAATIIGNANPRAYSGEIGPGRPIQHLDAATQAAILSAADSAFVEGIRFSLATAMVLLALVLAAGFAWFPRGKGSIADAERDAKARRRRSPAKTIFRSRTVPPKGSFAALAQNCRYVLHAFQKKPKRRQGAKSRHQLRKTIVISCE